MSDGNNSDQVDNPKKYKDLQEQKGVSKEEAARKADSDNETFDDQGDSPKYEKWTDIELKEKAKEVRVDNYSELNRQELIEALRDN
jgi:hypothetical protein